ncbi:6-phosphofructokinase isozyme 2 [Chryseobacterium nakagawai]|uniref:1-phosphofructokinase family hexose kinase n=1 Tax=Chryseobacterium nakagawai TaxID=1241982 RepID=A0AAD0YPG2_CHRNA|nr:1-phosphofructokinase family hexose kinase [Chryseobacterium nakagawai]AZA92910.1 1-phosphofructokinase family hexose kinase [Chryseobacterium nakagawai]VEH19528.1 6-phosphofructokinase isozyme 2 [Chryseobacterium nakagawai]
MEKSILTITLNPSVDKSSSVASIIPEKKLRCHSPKYEAGGGGVNVSRALKRLGISSDMFFTSGGRTGRLLEELLQAEQLNLVSFPTTAETRENFTVLDTSNNKQYRFGFPGELLTQDEQKEILNSVKVVNPFPDFVVISGSLPAETDSNLMKQLVSTCKSKGSKVIIDTSGEALKTAVEEGVFLLKPNIGELAVLVGKDKLEDDDVDRAAQLIISQGKAEIVVVSLGSQGAILFSAAEKIQIAAPDVEVKSTVGAGDSMVAGMVSVLVKGGNYKEVLSMGIACGSATTMAEGTGLFTKQNARRLFNEIGSST